MWTKEEKVKVNELIRAYRSIMIQNGFNVRAVVEVKYSNAISTFGRCRRVSPTQCIITIAHIAMDSGADNLKNTIVHELCHAVIADHNVGHNYVWKTIAKQMSVLFNTRITVYVSEAEQKEQIAIQKKKRTKFIIKCKDCGQEYKYMRETRTVRMIKYSKNHGCTCGRCKSSNLVVI